MKKILCFICILVTFFLLSALSVFAAPVVDTSKASSGYITVTTDAASSKTPMVVQIKNGSQTYNYIFTDNNPTNLPLQLGSGTYQIMVLKQVSGTKYQAVTTQSLAVTDAGTNVYLNSIQLINFNGDMASIQALTTIMNGASDNMGKTTLLYNYMVDNFSYDFDEANALAGATNYLPNIDKTFNSKKGICYDLSSLFASALRYNGIPAKLMMGYTPNIPTYHAWNEVYLNKTWNVVDTTYDIGVKSAGITTTMIKSAADYTATKAY